MRTTEKEKTRIHIALHELGIDHASRCQLRRISMTLQRWFEMECGADNGCIERDEESGLPYWLNSTTMKRSRIADKEKGALKRLEKIMEQFPDLTYYVQTDPRGCALYILKKMDVIGTNIDQVYSRGVAVY